MSDGIDLLDLNELRPELEAFLRRSRSADESILQDARALARRLRDLPDSDVENWDDLPTLPGITLTPSEATSSWAATRVTLTTGESTITCWNDSGNLALIASFRGAVEDSLIVEVGDRYWASRATEHGESRISLDPNVEGPADRRHFADLERRGREEMNRWQKKHPKSPRWVCSNCAWQNEDDDPACRVCGLAKALVGAGLEISRESRPTLVEPYPEPDEAPLSNVMALPPGIDEILRGLIARTAKAPADPRFELVLRGFTPETRGAIRDALLKTSPDAEKLLASVPSLIAGGLSVTKARDLSEKLEALGASIEIRKDRS